MGIRTLLIAWNNRLARRRLARVEPEALLLLAPHCLQRRACDRKLVPDVDRCARCGACNIAELLRLRDTFGLRCLVAAGGRQALDMVKDSSVRGVLAVACEKELWDGIRAAFPKPVLAIINERPRGPCLDTRVNTLTVARELEAWQAAFNRRKGSAPQTAWPSAKALPEGTSAEDPATVLDARPGGNG